MRGVTFDKYSSFKSKGERQIAGFLDSQKIAYQYEYPLAVVDRGKARLWYPDFRLPEYSMIIEYLGMNGNSSYNSQVAHKIEVYQEAGIDGIFLIDSTMRGQWQKTSIERIEQVCEGKLRKIKRHRASRSLGELLL